MRDLAAAAIDAPRLCGAIDLLKQRFAAGIERDGIVDVAFIGNASGLYAWEPTPIVDVDVCLFVADETAAGLWLAAVRDELRSAIEALGYGFELRIVRGPYKRALESIERPVIVAHLAVYTEQSYVETAAPFLKWGWRKYRCLREPDRLARLAPPRPGLLDLLDGRGGVRRRLATLESGRLAMIERTLPDLRETELEVLASDPLFTEVCFAAGAACARNHGRALAHDEADRLANRDYFAWYVADVFASRELERLMELKFHARDHGYSGMAGGARELAITYLSALEAHLSRSMLAPTATGARI